MKLTVFQHGEIRDENDKSFKKGLTASILYLLLLTIGEF